MIERKVTNTRKDEKGRVIALCNPVEWWSPRTAIEITNDIEESFYTYYVIIGGQRVLIKVANGSAEKYLRTDPDKTAKNNLDDLPVLESIIKNERHFMNIKYDSVNGINEVMLTFDDGPHATLTPKLLDLLKQENIRAMFFVLGVNVAADNNLEIVKRAFEEGHIIGNHTYFHRNLRSLTDFEIKSEILNTEEFIKEYMPTPKPFRPPYGATNSRVNTIVKELGYVNALWNVDTLDWKDKSIKWVENSIPQINAREYNVVLMHDTYETTINNVSELIKAIKNKNGLYEFISYV